jgi:cell division protein FtsL
MNTVLDKPAVNTAVRDQAAALHNAQIKERYERLRNVEADQFAQFEQDSQAQPRASVLAPERPAPRTSEQTPSVTEYTRREEDYAIFTPEALDRAMERSVPTAPVYAPPVQPMPVAVVEPTVAVERVAQYSLSALAKKVLVAFACVVVALLTVIAINSYVITQKRIRVEKLEQKRQQLEEKNQEIQKRIQQATNEDTIRAFIQENGMVQIG